VILNKVVDLDPTHGYDAFSSVFGDMFEMGIIDPAKVVRCALQNAASAAGMMLTIGCAMIEDEGHVQNK
jgi:chaperonin GroEL